MPNVGDFGVQSGGGWGGLLIRLGTFSRYGHACVIVGASPAAAEVRIVEATPGGARARWARHDEFVWSRCPLSDTQRGQIRELALACVGLPYDWASIAGFVVRFWGAKLRNQSGDHADAKLICSELVAWCYRLRSHQVMFRPVTSGSTSPRRRRDGPGRAPRG